MKSRQATWASNEKLRMKIILGGKCVICGIRECLTFDCIVPTGHEHHRIGSTARVTFYREQMRKGNLQLLCSAHNSSKGALPMPRYIPHPKQSELIRSDFDTVSAWP